MNFILTIDTEADNQWDHGRYLTVDNIKYVPRFQELCNKYLVRPTYLITSEICEDSFARELLRDYVYNDSAEVGAHLHPWTTPPWLNMDGYRYNDHYHAFAHDLPSDLLTNKIIYLTDQIGTSFGKRPTSFRAGRYGFSENVARVLASNGYLVDSSVTPFISWKAFPGAPDKQGGPDFMNFRAFPLNYEFGQKQLVEIPVTILPTVFPLNRDNIFSQTYLKYKDKNILFKILRHFFFSYQPYWLRPMPWMTVEMLESVVIEAERLKLPYLVMMFHSSELMPGCSIYRDDKESVEKLYVLLERFFELLDYRNIPTIRLTEAAQKFSKQPETVAYSYNEKH